MKKWFQICKKWERGGARVIAITQEDNTEVEKSADRVIYIPKVDDMFASITAVIPM